MRGNARHDDCVVVHVRGYGKWNQQSNHFQDATRVTWGTREREREREREMEFVLIHGCGKILSVDQKWCGGNTHIHPTVGGSLVPHVYGERERSSGTASHITFFVLRFPCTTFCSSSRTSVTRRTLRSFGTRQLVPCTEYVFGTYRSSTATTLSTS